MSDGLKRRCLHLFVDFPDHVQEAKIIQRKVPGIDEQLTRQVVLANANAMGSDLASGPLERIDVIPSRPNPCCAGR
jgi:MoxR-like ATPase